MAAAIRTLRPDRQWVANQLSRGASGGQIAGYERGCMRVTATELTGTVENRAVATSLAFAVNLATDADMRQWDQPKRAGDVLLYTPGTEHRATYFGHASYVVLDVPRDHILTEASLEGIPVAPSDLDRARVLPSRIDPARLAWLRGAVRSLHAGRMPPMPPGMRMEAIMFAAFVHLFAGPDRRPDRLAEAQAARIVRRARAMIEAAIAEPIPVDSLCTAVGCSRSALYRAFDLCLGESPRSYVLKLRLNRIREDLASPKEADLTVTTVSHRWGITELGRLAERYRAQFGELPSETLARRRPAARLPIRHGILEQFA